LTLQGEMRRNSRHGGFCLSKTRHNLRDGKSRRGFKLDKMEENQTWITHRPGSQKKAFTYHERCRCRLVQPWAGRNKGPKTHRSPSRTQIGPQKSRRGLLWGPRKKKLCETFAREPAQVVPQAGAAIESTHKKEQRESPTHPRGDST